MLNRHRLRAHVFFTLPMLTIYAIFFFAPLILGIFYSLTDWNGMSSSFSFVGLSNYQTVLNNRHAMRALGFTIRYALMLSVSILVLSLLLAQLLNSRIPGRTVIRSIYFFPAVLSAMIVGLIFNEIYYRILPPIGDTLGIEWLQKSLASSPGTAPYSILIANAWQAVAIPTAIVIAGLQSIPQELYEVASIDGASKLRSFFAITLPFLAPTLTIVLVLAVKDGLLLFDYVQAITSGGPAGSTHSVGTYIYQQAFENMRYSLSEASSVLLFLIVACFGLIYIRTMRLIEAKEG
jgi:raffinose/stachyose/melibiose transport system permease protein